MREHVAAQAEQDALTDLGHRELLYVVGDQVDHGDCGEHAEQDSQASEVASNYEAVDADLDHPGEGHQGGRECEHRQEGQYGQVPVEHDVRENPDHDPLVVDLAEGLLVAGLASPGAGEHRAHHDSASRPTDSVGASTSLITSSCGRSWSSYISL